jgi:hypothetical protein
MTRMIVHYSYPKGANRVRASSGQGLRRRPGVGGFILALVSS